MKIWNQAHIRLIELVQGLNNLESVSTLKIHFTSILKNLAGLDNLVYVNDWIEINDNDSLSSLVGLNPELVFGPGIGGNNLFIYDNPVLSYCSIK